MDFTLCYELSENHREKITAVSEMLIDSPRIVCVNHNSGETVQIIAGA